MAEKSLKKNAFYSFLKAFMTLVFPIITFPYASRILTPEGIGKVNFANSIVSYFVMLAGLGISTYATREAAKVRDNKIELITFFKEIVLINLISSFISYFLFFIFLLVVPKFNQYTLLLLISSIRILFTTLGLDWFYSALEEFKYITIRSVIFQIISLLILFIFVKTKEDILWYVIFGLISSVGSNICNFFYCRKFINLQVKVELNLKKHIKPIFIFFGMTVATSIYTMLDTSMLGFLSTDVEVGYYSAATKLNHMILSLIVAITGVLLPRFSIYIKNKDYVNFQNLFDKSFSIITLLSIPLAAGLFLLAEPVTLFLSGKEYIASVKSMQIMTPIIYIISIASIAGSKILPVMNKEKISLISYIIGACSNLILNFLLIPRYGSFGAAIGTLCAETFVTGFQVIYLRKYIINKNNLITLLQTLISTVFMSMSVILVCYLLNHILLKIFLSVFVGIIVYVISLCLCKNKYFMEYFNLIKGKIIKNGKNSCGNNLV